MKNHAIYFISYTTLASAGHEPVTRKITCIFGVPFYQSSGLNSGLLDTWFPFLGLHLPDSSNTIPGWFRKPNDVGIVQLSDIAQDFISNHPLPGDNTYSRFATTKCLLISALLGGGVWETEAGITLSSKLQRKFPRFFQKFSFTLIDTHIKFDPNKQHFLDNSPKGIKLFMQVNEAIGGAQTNSDLSYNFAPSEWINVLRDLTIKKACTLKFRQPLITDYFQPAAAVLPAVDFPRSLPEIFTPPDSYVKNDLNVEIEYLRRVIQTICGMYSEAVKAFAKSNSLTRFYKSFYKNDQQVVVAHFLADGNIIIRPVLPIYESKMTRIWKGYSITHDKYVAVKFSERFGAHSIAPLLKAARHPHVLPVYGVIYSEIDKECNEYTLFTHYCTGLTLEDAFKKVKLPHSLIMKIFIELLSGLA